MPVVTTSVRSVFARDARHSMPNTPSGRSNSVSSGNETKREKMKGENKKKLWQASKHFAPSFPRQSASSHTVQRSRHGRGEFVAALESASDNAMPGYYSVYSFPRGHSSDGFIPDVDCIFIDLDIIGDSYNPKRGLTDIADWRREMSALLARSRMIAQSLLDDGADAQFRAVLSGHKGVHLYLDFPTIAPENGTLQQFKSGLKAYGEDVIDHLNALANGVDIRPWFDVDGSDLARLGRHPNTRHHGTEYDDVDRWCVPVTIEELASVTVDDYLELTKQPRAVIESMHRSPSRKAGYKATQRIRNASTSTNGSGFGGSTFNRKAVKAYRKNSNDRLEVEDLMDPIIMGDKPCVQAFRQRDDAYSHGHESRMMEISIMGRFIEKDVPIDVMHEFFAEIPGYDEEYTQDLIEDLIGRGYSEFQCANVCGGEKSDGTWVSGQARRFCLGGDCRIYERSDNLDLTY